MADPDNDCRGDGNYLDEPQRFEDRVEVETEELELNPELEQEIVQSVGHKLSGGLKLLMAQASTDVMKDTLMVLRTAKNKAGLFRKAIVKQ